MKKEDFISSLVVFVVALPLSLGIAMASGVGPVAGLITAIIGGIIGGTLAGAPLMVSGPAAGMTALVLQIVQSHGLTALAWITIFSGLIQIALGSFRSGKIFEFVPHSVLHGMLSAIGFIILIGQLHVLIGHSIPKTTFIGIQELYDRVILSGAQTLFTPVVLCGVLGVLIQIFWPKFSPKSLKWMPGALPAVVLVTPLSGLWDMPRVEIPPLAGSMAQLWQEMQATFGADLTRFVGPAFGVALVGSAESLLTARAIDNLVPVQHRTVANLNRELFAQGAVNFLSGIFGGTPSTGVMVRSAANVSAGAKTRWSSVLHGGWILLFVLLLPGLLKQIPLTVLASILVVTGVKLLNIKVWLKELTHERKAAVIWLATSVLIVATDLLRGLALGLLIAAVLSFKEISNYFQQRKA